MRLSERMIMLQVVDNQWKDNLLAMDHLKEGIGLRGYGQKDPLIEYKKESYGMFQAMMDRIESETVRVLWTMQVTVTGGGEQRPAEPRPSQMDDYMRDLERKRQRQLDEIRLSTGADAPAVQQVVRGDKVGRNDPCPCGSGKKYKKCCGAAV
jgi:preprotein translocase subunit SecA